MLVHEFSQAFYMILTVTVWVKALINLVVAGILVDGIKQVRNLLTKLPYEYLSILSLQLHSNDLFPLPPG